DRERDALRKKLESLDRKGDNEKSRIKELELKSGKWVVGTDVKAFCFAAPQFVVVSNANEESVRRAVVRLEDIYAAYIDYLPPRKKTGKPTQIILVRSVKEYLELNRTKGRDILNPA